MSDLREKARSRVKALANAVKGDERWDLNDELMCQVFGFTMYGYAFGLGRIVCFMDVEDIQALATAQLSELGIGAKYASGMIAAAHVEFMTEGNESLHNRLIGIGHSHFISEDLTELIDSVFQNTEAIRKATG
ncbi:MAG: hypothetical protein CMO80_16625 [Verrucomicrobiales bacterium]|nr:hypothetical protein [Verrucomicrobiales bacterium]|tara:strand:+ start:262 stop:660 length:399 start_codon:yes stop_codon:yes gene_type:complete